MDRSSSNAFAFILGAVVVAVLAIGWFVWSGGEAPAADKPEITIDLPG
ncbi:hypothetical protein [Frigidibacter sp. MR17.24]